LVFAGGALSWLVSDSNRAVGDSHSYAGLVSLEDELVVAGGALSGREGGFAVSDRLDASVLGGISTINNELVSTSSVAALACNLSGSGIIGSFVSSASSDGGSSNTGSVVGSSEDGGSNALFAVLGSGASGSCAITALVLGAFTGGKGGSGEHESDGNKFSSQLHFFR
jgi:hypothetical protein